MTLYRPNLFRVDDREALCDFVERHAFGTLVTRAGDGFDVSHVPFLVERAVDGGLRLLTHMARANPQSGSMEGSDPVLAIFHGPHAYVSPSWYGHHPAVPTWNYAVVHAHGRARALAEEELLDLLGRLSSKYEEGRPAPWRMEALSQDFVAKMLSAIRGFAIEVERIEGKFKLSQNRPADDAERVVAALEAGGETALAQLMRAHARRRPS